MTWSVNWPLIPSSTSLRWNRCFSYSEFGTSSGSVTNRVGASIRTRPSASMTPERKVIDEMCPSPVARRLRMNRREPSGRPDWSGCQTIDGLNSAADSSAYSCVKYAPISSRRLSLMSWSVSRSVLDGSKRRWKKSRIRWCRPWNSRMTSASSRSTSGSASAMTRAMIFVDPLFARRPEGPDDDARIVRLEDDPGAFDVHVRTFRLYVKESASWPDDLSAGRPPEPREQVHLGQREQEGEGRLGPLVLVDAVLRAARRGSRPCSRRRAARPRSLRPRNQSKADAGLVQPALVAGGAVGVQAGGDGRLRLERLLVELGRLAPLV